MQQKLEFETNLFQELQKEYTSAVSSRTLLESQLKENQSVAQEFKLLKSDANIYKLMGPVLVKQDKPEAVGNVDKRIEFIQLEITRMESVIKDLSEKQEKKKIQVVELQTAIQQQQQQIPA